MNCLKKIKRKGRNHPRLVVSAFQDKGRGYPYVRYGIADAKCLIAVQKGDVDGLARWQNRRTVYWERLLALRPRDNEFFSY